MPTRKRFTVLFQKGAIIHLQKTVDYYNDQQSGLGKRFAMAVKKSASVLEVNPFFQIRYDSIRCLPINKFPFMIHFTVNEELKRIRIFAILHTSLNPEKYWTDID